MKNSPSSANFPNRKILRPLLPPYVQIEERVRYSETDKMGVAHNKSFFEWFELGRTEYCRHKGLSYREIEERGFYLVVAEASCRYRRPLRYDERFLIRTSLRDSTPRKTVFAYELRSADGDVLIAQGYTVHVSVNREGTVTPLPSDILEKIRRP
jgi:acyl-CoA thioester hydrolase